MPNKLFLETFPMYRKFEINVDPIAHTMYGYSGTTLEKLPRPAINMYCSQCISMQTFNMVNNYWDDDDLSYASSGPLGITFRLKYLCASCGNKLILFFVEFGQTQKTTGKTEAVSYWIRKVGQNPPWEIEVDKKLESILGTSSDLYKKGLVSESQNYGIGAYAYYRRIVEETIDSLLVSIFELIDSGKEKDKYAKALEKTKKAKNAEEKIELVKDLLPVSLRPDDVNPLEVIYSSLSEGLHGKTDEECLELADSIRKSLIFLVGQLLSQKQSKKEFTESMRKLLDKKK